MSAFAAVILPAVLAVAAVDEPTGRLTSATAAAAAVLWTILLLAAVGVALSFGHPAPRHARGRRRPRHMRPRTA